MRHCVGRTEHGVKGSIPTGSLLLSSFDLPAISNFDMNTGPVMREKDWNRFF